MWEPHIAHDFLEALNRDPNCGVIDIGANIGFYTMLAASAGHRVIAIEPYLESIHRIHRAAVVEKVQNRFGAEL